MSLLRLLTTGKSLVGLKDSGNSYSLATRSRLPKFVSKKNPFRASTRPEPAVLLPGQDLASVPAQVGNPMNPGNSDGPSIRLPITAASENAVMHTAFSGAAKADKAPMAEKTRGKRSFGWRTFLPWMRKKPPQSAIPRFPNVLVQSELSLDGVKVVRNDLSDSDLEIVPTKPATLAAELKSPRLDPKTAPVENSCDRLVGRVVGAGKT